MNQCASRTGPHARERDGDPGNWYPQLRLQSSLPPEPSSVGQIRRGVADLAEAAGVHGGQLDAIRLAVSEAVTNIVLHAYAGGKGEVHVTAEVAAGELWVLVADDGRGIQMGSASRGLGLGLALMSEVCDGFSVVDRGGGGTELRLRFKIATPRGPCTGGQERGSVSSARSETRPGRSPRRASALP